MDRVLELTDPIIIRIEASTDILQELAASNDFSPFVLQQLSSSAWAYTLDESICIVTRNFTAIALLERHQPGEAALVLKKISRTTPQDVTAAFREGYKISASWTFDAASASQTGSPSGAEQLWKKLGGEGTEDTIYSSSSAKQEMPSGSLPTPTMRDASLDQEKVAAEGPILPQNEIDRLIASLHDKVEDKPIGPPSYYVAPPETAMEQLPPLREMEISVQKVEDKPIGPPSYYAAPPEKAMEQSPPVQETEAHIQHEQPVSQPLWREDENLPLSPSYIGSDTGVNHDEWIETPNSAAQPIEISHESAKKLIDFVTNKSYAVIVFERREDFDREFENFRDGVSGTLLTFWDNHIVSSRIGALHARIIEDYRARYRITAASLEASITHLRQQEQLLPNIQENRDRQRILILEADKVIHEMHTMRMKRVIETHEGRFLAKKVFGIEAVRQSLLPKLTRHSYSVMRRSTPSFVNRLRFVKLRLKFLTVQKQLELLFDKLAFLEREVQRRLEYQADWQALVARQTKIQREQEEIGRFIRAAASIPGGPVADAESLNLWLKSEWGAVRRRERFLRAWQECLVDERAWSVRTNDEPVVVLGDRSLLTLPGVARGAFVVVLAQNPTTIMAEVPEECTGWVMVDPGLKIVDSGRGAGPDVDPFLGLVSDLAKEMELGMQEALQILGFEDRIRQGMK